MQQGQVFTDVNNDPPSTVEFVVRYPLLISTLLANFCLVGQSSRRNNRYQTSEVEEHHYLLVFPAS